jgi:hypothetical protein
MHDPHQVATLALRYFQAIDYLHAKGLEVDWDLPVVPSCDDVAPGAFGVTFEIPGRKPIGYLPAAATVRDMTRRDLRRALEILEIEDPTSYAILRQELGAPSYGAALQREWDAAADAHDAAYQATIEIKILRQQIRQYRRELTREGMDPDVESDDPRYRMAEALLIKLEEKEAAALDLYRAVGPHLVRTTLRVLEAAEALIKFLPR